MTINTDLVTIETPPCLVCRRTSRITMPRKAFRDWQNGELIQYAWLEGSADEREMLINGTHPDCFDEMMKEEDDG